MLGPRLAKSPSLFLLGARSASSSTGRGNGPSSNASSHVTQARGFQQASPRWSLETSSVKGAAQGSLSAPLMVESLKGGQHEFSRTRFRDILDYDETHLKHTTEKTHTKAEHAKGLQDVPDREVVDRRVAKLSDEERMESERMRILEGPACSISLHGCMQSNVPQPFNPQGRNPSHLNMPGAGILSGQKYDYGEIHRVHPTNQGWRSFHTEAPRQTSVQGIQGDMDQDYFGEYLSNCQKYNLNCAQQMAEYRAGTKTLQQIMEEQEALVVELKAAGMAPGFVFEPPTVQGIQGDDDERFRLWQENCATYNFQNCSEQSVDLAEGRVTLQQVLKEQEEMITRIAEKWPAGTATPTGQQANAYATQAAPAEPEVGQGQGQSSLSQRERLKLVMRDYGGAVMVFHIGCALTSLGTFYAIVSSGVDMVAVLKWFGAGGSALESRIGQGASTFAVAYILHKSTVPLRIGITLTCAPLLVRYLRRIGFLSTPKPK